MVVAQQSTQLFAAINFPSDLANFRAGFDQPVFQPLMIASGVIMVDRRVGRRPQLVHVEEDHLIKALRFQAQKKSFNKSIAIGRSRRNEHRLDVGVLLQKITKGQKLRIAVNHQMRVPIQETIFHIGQVPRHLPDPRYIGIRRDPGQLHARTLQVHHDEQVHRDQSTWRPDFHSREIDRRQRLPMRFQERRPARVLLPVRCRFDAIVLQDIADGLILRVWDDSSCGYLSTQLMTPHCN